MFLQYCVLKICSKIFNKLRMFRNNQYDKYQFGHRFNTIVLPVLSTETLIHMQKHVVDPVYQQPYSLGRQPKITSIIYR